MVGRYFYEATLPTETAGPDIALQFPPDYPGRRHGISSSIPDLPAWSFQGVAEVTRKRPHAAATGFQEYD
ncbi:MAG: hypothetical protein DRH37_11580 [Deltaproteobacteria bacterium]|nr:MAG: hypothetical protein DRH37_11580 [Deltaproteobacteria bacterium]